MRLLLACMMIALVGMICLPAFADDDDLLEQNIKNTTQDGLTMRDGRDYTYANGTVVENPHLQDSVVNLRNIFDFTDSLVYQQDVRTVKNLSATPFSQMDPARIQDVRNIGCYIVRRRGAANSQYATDDISIFYKNFCADAQ